MTVRFSLAAPEPPGDFARVLIGPSVVIYRTEDSLTAVYVKVNDRDIAEHLVDVLNAEVEQEAQDKAAAAALEDQLACQRDNATWPWLREAQEKVSDAQQAVVDAHQDLASAQITQAQACRRWVYVGIPDEHVGRAIEADGFAVSSDGLLEVYKCGGLVASFAPGAWASAVYE